MTDKQRSTSRHPHSKHRRRYINPHLLFGGLGLAVSVGLAFLIGAILFPQGSWLFPWLISVNIVTFLLFGYDKMISSTDSLRVPEAVLLVPVYLGGFVGGPMGSTFFRHKTLKTTFKVVMWVGVAVSIGWVAFYFFGIGR